MHLKRAGICTRMIIYAHYIAAIYYVFIIGVFRVFDALCCGGENGYIKMIHYALLVIGLIS